MDKLLKTELANFLILAFKEKVEFWLPDIGTIKESLVDMFFQLKVREQRKVEHNE